MTANSSGGYVASASTDAYANTDFIYGKRSMMYMVMKAGMLVNTIMVTIGIRHTRVIVVVRYTIRIHIPEVSPELMVNG